MRNGSDGAWQVEEGIVLTLWETRSVLPPSMSMPASLNEAGSAQTNGLELCRPWKLEKWWQSYTFNVDGTLYTAFCISIDVLVDVEIHHERFGLIVLLSGVVIPVGFSLLRFRPSPKRWTSALNSRFVYLSCSGRGETLQSLPSGRGGCVATIAASLSLPLSIPVLR
ncbi:hypothetical protein F4818DRAFT_442432 [Hypoxylon cercidicola]|nr:hypothetical protein F4818DRAFT_442432 [Hypoxylon cercidicola]